MKLNKKGGFTLIEIMIVIVIISLLAVTLVPKLTGAQARSRDTARQASLLSMKAVLTTMYDDFSQYPLTLNDTIAKNEDGTALGNHCLSSDFKGTVHDDFSTYLDGGKASADPQKTNKIGGCETPGSYLYVALAKNNMDRAGFILGAQTETYQKSNAIFSGTKISTTDGKVDITDVDPAIYNTDATIVELKDAEVDKAVYVTIGG